MILATALLAGRPEPIAAQMCAVYGDGPRWLDTIPFDHYSATHHLQVVGGIAYVPVQRPPDRGGDNSLYIIDVTHPDTPAFVGELELPFPEDVAVVGDHAFVVTKDHGLFTVNVASPASPYEVGSVELTDRGSSVAAEGSLAAVLTGQGLDVIDLSTPQSPIVVGSVSILGVDQFYRSEVLVSDGFAYVVFRGGGLHEVDLSTPEAPTLTRIIATGGESQGVDVVGGYAYVSERNEFLIIDLSTGTIVGRGAVAGNARGIDIVDNLAFVAARNKLHVFDVSLPSSPQQIGILGIETGAVAVEGNTVFLASIEFSSVDVTVPVSIASTGHVVNTSKGVGVALSGNYAYVADVWSGLEVMDVSVPENPSSVGLAPISGSTWSVAVQGRYAYVGTDYGVEIFDLSDPIQPQLVHRVSLGATDGIALKGDYIYAATGAFHILNNEDPTAVVGMGWVDEPGFGISGDVHVVGQYAYVEDYSYGMVVIDIADPWAPFLAWDPRTEGSLAGRVVGLDVVDSYAYLTSVSNRLVVVDISAPLAPVRVATKALPGPALDVFVSAGIAYIATYQGGVHAVDVTDPLSPRLLGTNSAPSSPEAVVASSQHVFSVGSSLHILPKECSGIVPVEPLSFGQLKGKFR